MINYSCNLSFNNLFLLFPLIYNNGRHEMPTAKGILIFFAQVVYRLVSDIC